MYLVDHENTAPLLQEYKETLISADKLCDIVDDEATPYASKYKARTLLDQIIAKLEATHTIAMLEKKKALVDGMSCRIAAARVRLGTISWECEEPHNAQTDLDLACEFYFPGLVESINQLTVENDNTESKAEQSEDFKVHSPVLPPLLKTDSYPSLELASDAMKALNILGILWAGRGQVRKSFQYLLGANTLYTTIKDGADFKAKAHVAPAVIEDVENIYTHNCFYLAQAYGNIGDSKLSSQFCHRTLQRQFTYNLKPFFKSVLASANFSESISAIVSKLKVALDWVKNCGGMSEFYMAMKQFRNCSLALSSAEKILRQYIIHSLDNLEPKVSSSSSSTTATQLSNLRQTSSEMEADLHRRFVTLDVFILKRAGSIHKDRLLALEMGESNYVPEIEDAEDDFQPLKKPPAESVFSFASSSSSSSSSSAAASSSSAAKDAGEVEFFAGIPVTPILLLSVREVDSFEKARSIFLRAAARIEAAKKYYVLDGFVTDHSTILQEHSQLYHHLSLFETETKRKLAMESRRIDMLSPLLAQLNKASYEVLHKQISYELGESALAMLEIKLDKLRSRDAHGEIDFRKLKSAEKLKCNEYSKTALVMFAHFTYMYASVKDRIPTKSSAHFETLPLYEIAECACCDPDESLISEEEIRPFLNSHFLSCRVLSKVIPSVSDLPPNGLKAHYLVVCLRRYTWLVEFAPRICQRRGVDLKDYFSDEMKICQDLVKLLPSKIDRMNYLGEGGLSL